MFYKKDNDYELIYMVRENDNGSYNTLFNKYLPIMKRLSYNYYVKYKNYGADYDDFLQESYVAFHNALTKFNENRNVLFYTFVTLCINRALLSFCKKITCDKKNISNLLLVDIDNYDICGESNIDDYIKYDENRDILKKILYSLDFDDACVFELKINGFSYKEISVLLDIPLRTVQFRGSKVRNKIGFV